MELLDEHKIVVEWTKDSKLTLIVRCYQEYTEIHGNAMASGDDAADEECENWIRNELDRGNCWAWCHVEVHAELQLQRPIGQNYIRHEVVKSDADSLGGCSYKSAEDFMQEGGYFDDMKKHALESIRERDPRVKEALAASLKEVMEVGFPGIQHTIDTEGEAALIPALQRARAAMKLAND